MNPSLLFSLILAAAASAFPWAELSLSIEKDQYTSSDQMTLCRVRVVNHGSRTHPGRSLRFEARALEGGVVVARERGRFGLSLPPRGSLETLIGFVGRYDRFEVEPVEGDEGAPRRGKRRGRGR